MLRYRLLQARTADDPVRHEERAAFADRLGVSLEQIHTWDLLEGATSFEGVTDGMDAILVGGSGAFGIHDPEPWLAPFIDTLGALAAANFPTFASCFGFQGLVVALGGEVITDEANAEVGTFELSKLPEADDDPLFGPLPHRFHAQLGHKDRAARLPDGVTPLASSERCPYQAFRLGTQIYATQFHPELTQATNRARFMRYFATYASAFGEEKARDLLDGFQPSPEADTLLRRFHALLAGAHREQC